MVDFDYTKIVKACHEYESKRIEAIQKQYSEVEKAFNRYKVNALLAEVADVLTKQANERGYLNSDDIRMALAMLGIPEPVSVENIKWTKEFEP